jgi:hypothetical protein
LRVKAIYSQSIFFLSYIILQVSLIRTYVYELSDYVEGCYFRWIFSLFVCFIMYLHTHIAYVIKDRRSPYVFTSTSEWHFEQWIGSHVMSHTSHDRTTRLFYMLLAFTIQVTLSASKTNRKKRKLTSPRFSFYDY